MKLISCHIRNFGKLSNKDYNFKDGINSFIEDKEDLEKKRVFP